MVYRFILVSDEVDDFRRDITIDSDATFFDLHDAILESVNYSRDQMTSFFICDDDWSKETEITLVEMDTGSDEDAYVMEATRLSDVLEEEKQKLMYVFEYLTERAFFMELREITPGKNQEKAECVKSVGEPPVQVSAVEDFDTPLAKQVPGLEDDDFFNEDTDINLDEYDEEDFGDLSEGDPFSNY